MATNFNSRGRAKVLWLHLAKGHFESVNILWSTFPRHGSGEFDVIPINAHSVYLLMGASIEALAKGWLSQNHPDWIKDDKVESVIGGHNIVTHDLLSLVRDVVGIPLNAGESRLLEKLSAELKWSAKYAIPKNSSQLKEYFDNDRVGSNSTHLKIFREIYEKLLALV